MLRIVRTLSGKGNARSALILFISSALSSALGYAFLMLLAKKMSVADFGSLRLLIETSATLFPFLALGFQYTSTRVLIHAEVAERVRLKGAVLVLIAFSATGASIGISWLSSVIPGAVLGVYATIGGFSYIVFMTMCKEFANVILPTQKAVLLQSIHLALPQIILLVIIYIFEDLVSANKAVIVIVLVNLVISTTLLCVSGVSFSRLPDSVRHLIKNNSKIGFPIYCSSYVSMTGLLVYQLLAGINLTSVEYANLSMAVVLAGVVNLISTSVIMAKISDFANDREISIGVIKGALLAMIGAALFTLLSGWWLTHYVLGASFERVNRYLPFMVACSVFDGISYIFNRFFLTKNLVRVLLRISVANGAAILSLSLILTPLYGIVGVVATKTITAIITVIMNIAAYRRYLSSIKPS